MGIHITRYKTENGETRKDEGPAAQRAGKNETREEPRADGKNGRAGTPAKQGEQP